MPTYLKYNERPLLWMMVLLLLIFMMGCEDYEDKPYLLSAAEEAVCDRLTDTSSHNLVAADLRIFGPTWTGLNMETNLKSTERIGTSWYDVDLLIEPDVYIFINNEDTVAALQFLSFTYDDASETIDSIQIEYMYNPVGASSFIGLTHDTLLIVGANTEQKYVNFNLGLVSAGDEWNLSVENAMVRQSSAGRVHRLENSSLSDLTTAPASNYAPDISGYSVALEYLMADSIYVTEPDSMLRIEFEAILDAGYMLWNRQGLGLSTISFNASDYMTIAVWDENGTYLEPSDLSMSPELIAYCNELKTRAVYELGEATYLIQFRPHEEMEAREFKLAILEGE